MLLNKPAFYSPGAPLRLSMSEDVLLSAQAPEIFAADRSDNIMRYDLYAESDGSRSLLRSSFATYDIYIYIFQLKRTFDVLTTKTDKVIGLKTLSTSGILGTCRICSWWQLKQSCEKKR